MTDEAERFRAAGPWGSRAPASKLGDWKQRGTCGALPPADTPTSARLSIGERISARRHGMWTVSSSSGDRDLSTGPDRWQREESSWDRTRGVGLVWNGLLGN